MSGNNDQPASRLRHAPRRAMWAAAAAVILLTLAACASTNATTPSGPTPTPESFGASSHAAALTGAGSTAYAAANGYVPLPPQIRALAQTMLQQITGPSGTHLPGQL